MLVMLKTFHIEALSKDPQSKSFLDFRLVDDKNGKEIIRLRTHDIASMRRLMACLGSEADGLYSEKCSNEVPVEATHGLWDVFHPSEDELYIRQKMFSCQKRNDEISALGGGEADMIPSVPPSYEVTVNKLPLGFYFPEDTSITPSLNFQSDHTYPGSAMVLYDPSAPLPKAFRRPWHDTFRPPNGPPVFHPVSIGYGAEVGLPSGLQALWDYQRKTYFFLDHIRKISFFEDPRPPLEPPPAVTKVCQQYGPQIRETSIQPSVCRDGTVIASTAARALGRPCGHVIQACGVNGSPGQLGEGGTSGASGMHGRDGDCPGSSGSSGTSGCPGGYGKNGERGGDGIEASDMIVVLSGNANELLVSGSCRAAAKLGGDRAEEILFINCRGGDGGCGGKGGKGGTGGRGSDGGNGSRGIDGRSSHTGRGSDGGPGGDGGQGGSGGQGGPGGRGGDGGHAGYGGVCMLQSYDPTLLMLVDANVMSGSAGMGGAGGSGGSGGSGGIGGYGGQGGCGGQGGFSEDGRGATIRHPDGLPGRVGRAGPKGHSGTPGLDGLDGREGNSANNGGILWIVNDSEGKVLYQAGTRYDVNVTRFNVTSSIDDGIFEPNERILVSGVTVVNDGGLPLPEGAYLFMPSTETVKFESIKYKLPSDRLYPGMTHVIPTTFYGRTFDQPLPNIPGPFVSNASFMSRAELLGRPFEKSYLAEDLVIQYPVKLEYLHSSESLGRGEVSVLEIGVQNISSIAYGSCPGSGGNVSLQLHLDARLIPVGSANIGSMNIPYKVTYDPTAKDSMRIQMDQIPPHETVNVQVTVQMESRAELFEKLLWQADLYLRGKLVEYNMKDIRVSPFFTGTGPPGDVLMITSEFISRKEFVYWQKILELLKVNVQFWDTERYNGLSVDKSTNARHEISWEGKYTGKMILYPHCQLDLLHSADIARHFHGTGYPNSPLNEMHSSMVLFMSESNKQGSSSLEHYNGRDFPVLYHIAAAGDKVNLPENVVYGGKHLCDPECCEGGNIQPHMRWEKKYLSRVEKKCLQQAPVVYHRRFNMLRVGILQWSYGSVDIRKLPILRSSKFMVVDSHGRTTDFGFDDEKLTPTSSEIPLGSNYGQVFLITLNGLPIQSKMALLESNTEEENLGSSPTELTFFLPNGLSLSLAELAMITLVDEIADELYSYTGSSERLQIVASTIEQNPAAFVFNSATILQGLELAKKEIKNRKKKMKHSSISSFISNVKKFAENIKNILGQSGVKSGSLKELPCLSVLLNSDCVHRSHQHWVREGKWSLVDTYAY